MHTTTKSGLALTNASLTNGGTENHLLTLGKHPESIPMIKPDVNELLLELCLDEWLSQKIIDGVASMIAEFEFVGRVLATIMYPNFLLHSACAGIERSLEMQSWPSLGPAITHGQT